MLLTTLLILCSENVYYRPRSFDVTAELILLKYLDGGTIIRRIKVLSCEICSLYNNQQVGVLQKMIIETKRSPVKKFVMKINNKKFKFNNN